MKKVFKVLVMGLPESGKTHLAMKLREFLSNKNRDIKILDEYQNRIENNNFDFTFKGRIKHSINLYELSENSNVGMVICTSVMPFKECINSYQPDYLIWTNTIQKSKFNDLNEQWQDPIYTDNEINDLYHVNYNNITEDIIKRCTDPTDTLVSFKWVLENNYVWGSMTENKLYGLYDFITNRIVITYHEPHILEYVAELFSSRFDLKIVNLCTAKSLTEDLIDNTCCMNWTISNYSEVSSIGVAQRIKPRIVDADDVIKSDQSQDYSLIKRTQEYMIWTLEIVRNFDYHLKQKTATLSGNDIEKIYHEDYDYTFSDIFLDQPFDNDIYTPQSLSRLKDDRKKVFNIIYKEFDLDSAKKQIYPILQDYG